MHNLNGDQAALGSHGHISAALRSRSPVYYWQNTPQEQSRQEAICSKQSKWHVISFGSHGKWRRLARWKCKRAKRQVEVDTCCNDSLASLPSDWKAANVVDRSIRGAGYWKHAHL